MRVALATSRDLPAGDSDDAALRRALEDRGATVAIPVWNDPTVSWAEFDAVIPRTTWDYPVERDRFVGWAEVVSTTSLLLNPAPVIEWNTHKSYLRSVDVPQPSTVWCEQGVGCDLGRVLEAEGWERGLLKPAVGATASGTFRFDGAQTARAQAHLDELLQTGDALIQPYLSSVETEGERSVIFIEGTPTHAVRKLPVPGDFRVQEEHAATDEPYVPSSAELDFCLQAVGSIEAALTALGATQPLAYGRVDWLLGLEGEPLLNEVELVEPSLFFRHGPSAAVALSDAIIGRLAAR